MICFTCCDATNRAEVRLDYKVLNEVIIDTWFDLGNQFVSYHILLVSTDQYFKVSENSHDCDKTFITRLKQRQYSEDVTSSSRLTSGTFSAFTRR